MVKIGGGRDNDKSPILNASREFYEETMGIFGDEWQLIKDLLVSEPIYLKKNSFVFPLKVNFDENLPSYFSNIVNYFKNCSIPSEHPKLDYEIASCPKGYFELTALGWFTKDDIMELLHNGKLKKKTHSLIGELINIIES